MKQDDIIEQYGTTLIILFIIFLCISLGCLMQSTYFMNACFFILLLLPSVLMFARDDLLLAKDWFAWLTGTVVICMFVIMFFIWRRYSIFIILFQVLEIWFSIAGALLTFQVDFLSKGDFVWGRLVCGAFLSIFMLLSCSSMVRWEQNEAFFCFLYYFVL